MRAASFSTRVLAWFDVHGRHDLPWQQRRTPYRVWIAEIMLQQTQVGTVIPYYLRFIKTFPGLDTLASASLDHVLEHWSGLGYYSRARNLHKAARIIASEHGGVFPQEIEQLVALPGIGQSTAAAILAQALDQRHAILDGNVKRVLCRHHAIEGWPGKTGVMKQLWKLAEQHTPDERVADYTQAIMDLGATLCKRSSPRCEHCPLIADCVAYRHQSVQRYPSPRPKKILPVKAARLLLVTDSASGKLLLEKRPPSGIWGGLWSLPEAGVDEEIAQLCRRRWGLKVLNNEDCDAFRHTFSHYHFQITPCRVQVQLEPAAVQEPANIIWCSAGDATRRALAAPVARIIEQHART
ncbi:MAG: A/G-specific adenine glycosylase [Gammaproteobacteria bacterium]|nr:A/G-specific adenine glycosylase [Gammaproteobacteria bacterium]